MIYVLTNFSLELPIFNQICNENSTIQLNEKFKIQLHKLREHGTTIKIRDELIPINSLLLFQRIAIMKQRDEELKTCFKYKMSPYLLSLFFEEGMRKTKKICYIELMQDINVKLNN